MRGKVYHGYGKEQGQRITPAYAGKRFLFLGVIYYVWDHPRLCGEKFRTNIVDFFSYRITPAYAGKRLRSTDFSDVDRDHPRLCGEK